MKLSNRDWIQLSSYLDGELNPRDLNKIEERLKQEPALQLALEDLNQTKKTLQQTPKLRIPRNFILTPAMVGVKTRPRKVRSYRLVSALMTFLLIGVLVLDFGRFFMIGAMAPAAPKEVMLEAVSDSVAEALEEPALLGAEGDMESDRAVTETEAEAPQEEAPAVAAEAVEEGESAGFSQEAESKSTEEGSTDTAANQADEWQEEEAVDELVLPSQTLTPEITGTLVPQSPTSDLVPDEEIHELERIPSIDPFRVLEIILGVGAITFGIAAWVIKRKRS